MFKNIYLLVACWLMATSAHAQLLAVEVNGQWGAVDTTGKMVIDPTYRFLDDADQWGYLAATRDGKSGLINAQGKIVIPLEYDRVKAFDKEVICLWYRGKCGLRRPTGEIMAEIVYDRIVPWKGFYRTSLKGQIGLLAADGTKLLPPQYSSIEDPTAQKPFISVFKGAKQGLLNQTGQLIVPAEFDSIRLEIGLIAGYNGQAVTVFDLSADGSVASKKEYRTQPLWQMAKEQITQERKKQFLQTEPDAEKPRWQKNGFRWKLANAVGESLIGNAEFFRIGIDEASGKSYGMLALEEDETQIWYINHLQAKVLFQIKAKDIYITDFNQSNWARITLDSLRDGLVNQNGEIKKTLQVNGSEKRISDISNFNQGVAPVRIGSKWGVINGKAEWVAQPVYDQLDVYSDQGMAIARKGNKFGALDVQGREAIPFEYDGINPQEFGVFRVKKGQGNSGKWGLVDQRNRQIASFEYSMIFPFANNKEATVRKYDKLGVINISGREVMPPTVEADFMGAFENGIAFVGINPTVQTYPNGKREVLYEKKGYVKRDGSLATRLDYQLVEGFEEIWIAQKGVAKVMIDGKVGYIDHKGTIIISPAFDAIEGFEEIWNKASGLALIKKNGYFGMVDHKGMVVLKPRYAELDTRAFIDIYQQKKGIAKAKKGKYWGYMDYKEKEILPFEYGYVSNLSPDSVIYAKGYDAWGLISHKGDTIVPFVFDKVRFLPETDTRIFQVLKPGMFYQKLDSNGKVLGSSITDDLIPETKLIKKNNGIKKGKYEYLTDFNQYGLAIVKRKGLLGIVDKDGKTLVKPQYLDIGRYSEGYVWFRDQQTRKYGYFDTKGEVVIPAQFGAAGDFHDGLAPAGPSSAFWGFINTSGRMVIAPKYKEITAFSGGYAIVDGNIIIDERGKKTGDISFQAKVISGFENDRAILENTSGKFHITPYGNLAYLGTFDDVTPFYGDVAFVKRGEMWELVRFTTQLGEKQKNREVKESKVQMSLKEKRIYLAKYGEERIIKTPYGQMTQDMEWKKVKEGVWRMISKDGALVNETVYQQVTPVKQENGQHVFIVKATNKFSLYDSKGQQMTQLDFETVRVLPNGIIKAEAEGQIYYLRQDGAQIWPKK